MQIHAGPDPQNWCKVTIILDPELNLDPILFSVKTRGGEKGGKSAKQTYREKGNLCMGGGELV
jgi:hypothetical protein